MWHLLFWGHISTLLMLLFTNDLTGLKLHSSNCGEVYKYGAGALNVERQPWRNKGHQ